MRKQIPLVLLLVSFVGALLAAALFPKPADPFYLDDKHPFRSDWNAAIKGKLFYDNWEVRREVQDNFIVLMRDDNPVALDDYFKHCFVKEIYANDPMLERCPEYFTDEEYVDLVENNSYVSQKFKTVVLAYALYYGRGRMKDWSSSAQLIDSLSLLKDGEVNEELFFDYELNGRATLGVALDLHQEQSGLGNGRPESLDDLFKLTVARVLCRGEAFGSSVKFYKINTTEFDGSFSPDNDLIRNSFLKMGHRHFWVVHNGRWNKQIDPQPHYKSSLPFLRKLASEGYPPALVFLGNLYRQGLGVKKNLIRALGLYYASTSRSLKNPVSFESGIVLTNGGWWEVDQLERKLTSEQQMEAQAIARDIIQNIKKENGRALASASE